MIKAKDFFLPGNLISLSRIVLTFIFAKFFNEEKWVATIIVVLIVLITDFLDGAISRKLNQITDLGKILDPLADKIGLAIGMFMILIKVKVFLWPVIFLIFRDVVILTFGLIIMKKKNTIPSSNMIGKLTTTFLALSAFVFLFYILFKKQGLYNAGLIIYYIAIGFIFLSSFFYAKLAKNLLKKNN